MAGKGAGERLRGLGLHDTDVDQEAVAVVPGRVGMASTVGTGVGLATTITNPPAAPPALTSVPAASKSRAAAEVAALLSGRATIRESDIKPLLTRYTVRDPDTGDASFSDPAIANLYQAFQNARLIGKLQSYDLELPVSEVQRLSLSVPELVAKGQYTPPTTAYGVQAKESPAYLSSEAKAIAQAVPEVKAALAGGANPNDLAQRYGPKVVTAAITGVVNPIEPSAPIALMSFADYAAKLKAAGFGGDVSGNYADYLRSNHPEVVNTSLANLTRAGVINNGMLDVAAAQERGLAQDLISVGITATVTKQAVAQASAARAQQAAAARSQAEYQQALSAWLQGQVDRGQAKNLDQAKQQLAEVQSGKFLAFQPDDVDPEDLSKGKFVPVWAGYIAQREASGLTDKEIAEIYSGKYTITDTRGANVAVTRARQESWNNQQQVLSELQPYRSLPTEKQFGAGRVVDGYNLVGAIRAGYPAEKLRSVFGDAVVSQATLVTAQKPVSSAETIGSEKRWIDLRTNNQYTDTERATIIAARPGAINEMVRTPDSVQADIAKSGVYKILSAAPEFVAGKAAVKYTPLAGLVTNPVEKTALGAIDDVAQVIRGGTYAAASALVSMPLFFLGLAIDPAGTASGTAQGVWSSLSRTAMLAASRVATMPSKVTSDEYFQLGQDATTLALTALMIKGAVDATPKGVRDGILSGIRKVHYDESGYIQIPGTPEAVVEQVNSTRGTKLSTQQASDLTNALAQVQEAITDKSPYTLYAAGIDLRRVAGEIDSKLLTQYAEDIINFPHAYIDGINEIASKASASEAARANMVAKLQKAEEVATKVKPLATLSAEDVGMTEAQFSEFVKARVENPKLTPEEFNKSASLDAVVQEITGMFDKNERNFEYNQYLESSKALLKKIADARSEAKAAAKVEAAKRASDLQEVRTKLSKKSPVNDADIAKAKSVNAEIRAGLKAAQAKVAATEALIRQNAFSMSKTASYVAAETAAQVAAQAVTSTKVGAKTATQTATQTQTKTAAATAAAQALQAQLAQLLKQQQQEQTALEQALAQATATLTKAQAKVQGASRTAVLSQTKGQTATKPLTASLTATQQAIAAEIAQNEAVLAAVKPAVAPAVAVKPQVAPSATISGLTAPSPVTVLTPKQPTPKPPVKGAEPPVETPPITPPPEPPVGKPPPVKPPPNKPPPVKPPPNKPPPKPPPPPILTILTGKGGKKEAKLPIGSATWKQGWGWKWIPPELIGQTNVKPYTLPRGITPRGARTAGRTPAETIQLVGGGTLPTISVNLGKVNVYVAENASGIAFEGKGDLTDVGTMGSTTVGMASPAKGHGPLLETLSPMSLSSPFAETDRTPVRKSANRATISGKKSKRTERTRSEPMLGRLRL